MLQEHFAPYASDGCWAILYALHRRGFAVCESGEVLLVFDGCKEAVEGRLRLADVPSPPDSEMGSDRAFRLMDQPDLGSRIDELRVVWDLEVLAFSVIQVDVGREDVATVETIMAAESAARRRG